MCYQDIRCFTSKATNEMYMYYVWRQHKPVHLLVCSCIPLLTIKQREEERDLF